VRFDASGLDPLADGLQLVLSTCWPFETLTPGPERYLVHATMIGPGPRRFSAGREIVRAANGTARATRVATPANSQ
jgi:hypothetical protein